MAKRTSAADYRPGWQPISDLPVIAMSIRHMLAGAKDQYATLTACRPTPHVLDDELLDRVLAFYEEQRADIGLFEAQIERWQKEELMAPLRKQVEVLAGQLQEAAAVIDSVLDVAGELSDGTIDKVLAKSELQLGVEAILGRSSREDKTALDAALTAEQEEAAILIDARVQAVAADAADDYAIFAATGDLMPQFKPLLDLAGADPVLFESLCRRFPGVWVYAKILEGIASGIASGEIEVPQ